MKNQMEMRFKGVALDVCEVMEGTESGRMRRQACPCREGETDRPHGLAGFWFVLGLLLSLSVARAEAAASASDVRRDATVVAVERVLPSVVNRNFDGGTGGIRRRCCVSFLGMAGGPQTPFTAVDPESSSMRRDGS